MTFFDKLKFSSFRRKLCKKVKDLKWPEAKKYDIFDMPFPDDIPFEKPIMVLLNGRISFIYSKPGWRIYVALVCIDNKTFYFLETSNESRVFNSECFMNESIADFAQNQIIWLLLKNKKNYLKEIESWIEDLNSPWRSTEWKLNKS